MGHTSPACHVMPSCIVSSVALIRDAGRFTMVAIAQSVEHLIVVQEVARSSRVSHPALLLGFQVFPYIFCCGFSYLLGWR